LQAERSVRAIIRVHTAVGPGVTVEQPIALMPSNGVRIGLPTFVRPVRQLCDGAARSVADRVTVVGFYP
jgi:hypothetical protein